MYDSDKEVLEKKIQDVDKKYTILVHWTKRMTRTQKLQILKTRYIVLLLLLSMQKPQRLEKSYLISIIRLKNLFLIQRLQRLKVKYLALLIGLPKLL